VRNDYAATIAVREIQLDAAARNDLRQSGIQMLAQLSLALSSTVLLRSPHVFAVDDREFCAYETMNPSTLDTLRTVLFDTGMKVYEVNALLRGEAGVSTAHTVFAALESFVQGLRW
jgi:hypothetical protein